MFLIGSLKGFSNHIVQNRKMDSNCIESFEFLKLNLEYFRLQSVEIDSLSQMNYYKNLLLKYTVNQYLPNDFKKGYFQFTRKIVFIKNYGYCSIGIFKYLDYAASRQSRNFIFVNTDKKELIIWHYDNIRFKKNYLVVDFNTRGKHSFEPIIYSNKISQFVPICYVK